MRCQCLYGIHVFQSGWRHFSFNLSFGSERIWYLHIDWQLHVVIIRERLWNILGILRQVFYLPAWLIALWFSCADANALISLVIVPEINGILHVTWLPGRKTDNTTYRVSWEMESSIGSNEFMLVGTHNIIGTYYCRRNFKQFISFIFTLYWYYVLLLLFTSIILQQHCTCLLS